MKGFQRLIPLMRYLPEVDLRIAGTGPYEATLRALASDLPNVRFEGLLGGPGLARLFHGARAVVVPSLFPETFGYVVLEAFAVRTPVVVHQGGGALAETGVQSGGGLGYQTDAELLLALRRIVHDDDLRDELAHRGYAMRTGEWSEAAHLDRYFGLIQGIRAAKAPPSLPSSLGPSEHPYEHDRAAQLGPNTDAPTNRRPSRLPGPDDADAGLLRAPGRPAAGLDRRWRAAQHRLRPAR